MDTADLPWLSSPRMKVLFSILGILACTQALAKTIVEYGIFEKSSDGKFQSLCPVQADGNVLCTYTYGIQKSQLVIGKIDPSVHKQLIQALDTLGVLPLVSYDEAIRRLMPQASFLINGFYAKFESRTILLDFAHYYTPLSGSIPANITTTVSAVLKTLAPVYYSHLSRPNPLVKKTNHCPVLRGNYDCPKNALQITQVNYGPDELYVFHYSDRPNPFDFGANDLGMNNAYDRYIAVCTDKGLVLDGSLMRLVGKDLEFSSHSSATPTVCRRQNPIF